MSFRAGDSWPPNVAETSIMYFDDVPRNHDNFPLRGFSTATFWPKHRRVLNWTWHKLGTVRIFSDAKSLGQCRQPTFLPKVTVSSTIYGFCIAVPGGFSQRFSHVFKYMDVTFPGKVLMVIKNLFLLLIFCILQLFKTCVNQIRYGAIVARLQPFQSVSMQVVIRWSPDPIPRYFKWPIT